MPITLTIEAADANELHNLIGCLFQQERVTGGVHAAVASQNIIAAQSDVPAEKPKRASRSKKSETEPAPAAEDVQVPDFLKGKKAEGDAKTERPYAVFKADGSKFSDFADAEKALDRLTKEVEECGDLEALNNLTAHNTDTVGLFPAELQDRFSDLVDERYNALESDGEEEGDDDEGGATVDAATAETELKAYVKKKGLIPAKDLLSKHFKVNSFKQLKPEQYGKLVDELKKAA